MLTIWYIALSGPKCDVCADNYYGNPEVSEGSCVACDCNDKIDLLSPGNCDPHTGKCLRCLYETTGHHCEVCRPGFYRTANDEQCRGNVQLKSMNAIIQLFS